MKEDLYDHIIFDPPDPVTNDWTKKYQNARVLINLPTDNTQIASVKNKSNTRKTLQT